MLVDKFPDRIITIDNQEFLYFGGTAYLGLVQHKKFQEIVINNIKKWGTSFGSSRNANIQLEAYNLAEKYLASFINAEATLTVSSGSLAGKLVVELLTQQENIFYHLPNNHNAIQSINSLPVWINGSINPRLLDGKKEKIVILSDSVPTSTVVPIDLSFVAQIPNQKEITLVLDESHSIGIVGKQGRGLFSEIVYKNIKNKIMISSLGKALALTGGVIGGNSEFIKEIKQMGNFVSAAGMNAAFAVSIADAANIYKKQFEKLRKNLLYIDKKLKKTDDIFYDKFYPIIYPKSRNAFDILKAESIIITNFKYPNDIGYLNRIIITANHQKKDLDKLIAVLNNF